MRRKTMSATKLTADEITAAHDLYKSTQMTQADVASTYNVSASTLSRHFSEIDDEIEAMMKSGRSESEATQEARKAFKRRF